MTTHALGCCAAGEGFALPGAEPSYAPDLALQPIHIEVTLAFDPPAARAQGSVVTTLRGNRAGARALRLDAVDLAIEAVACPEKHALGWRYDGTGIDITWEEPFAAGEERRLEVRYAIADPITGMVFSRPDERAPKRPLFVATDHETERARYWLPCVDYPAVRTTFDFHLTAPREMTILANGALVSETGADGGRKTAHWRLDFPCPSYLCCLAIGCFVKRDAGAVEGIPVAYFAPETWTADHLERSFGRTPAMLRWLTKRLGQPFPFPKYFQIALPEIGGAMENISLVTWDDLFLLDEALASEWVRRVDSVNIHEMAHSYFGDAVVCRHFEHSWLKESWAVFIEQVWYEETRGKDEGDWDLHCNAESYFEEADQRYVRPIVTRTYSASWDLFDRHLYPGGAWRIHMLRRRVGDDAFWAATRDYLATFTRQVVETDDFRRMLEKHSGLNLTRFFDEWIYSPGFPKLKASYRLDAARGEATLVVEQTQADKEKGVGLFLLELAAAWEDDAGWHRAPIRLEGARASVTLRTTGTPRQVRLDPDGDWLFSLEFHPGDDLLKRTLTAATDLRGRIHAARELLRKGGRGNVAAVAEAMATETFFGVRAAVAGELGKSKDPAAAAPLARMLAEEKNPRAKAAVARACSGVRDPKVRDALRAFLSKAQPPGARAAALESLGAQRDPADLELLERASREEGIHGLTRAGALLGLGNLRDPRAAELLASRVGYGEEPEPSRPAALEGFARAGRWAERAARERCADRLAELTRDPRPRARLKAAAMLADLGAASAIPALESLKARHAAQDGPRIERLIARLRKGAEGEGTVALRAQVEKLEERVRKLDDRLQELEGRGEAR
ncbi:MAG: M1 family aminopeptidase [Planctomycetaceae bacterium]